LHSQIEKGAQNRKGLRTNKDDTLKKGEGKAEQGGLAVRVERLTDPRLLKVRKETCEGSRSLRRDKMFFE